ncbi:phage tail protein [Hylemonella gracilis]|nr:phage tail protein [Hylemonella gracilis]
MFVFSLPTLAFQQLEHQIAWRHANNERVGARAASQFLGPGEEAITLTGLVLPGFGKRLALDSLRFMADTGAGYVLVDGLGRIYGRFVIVELRQTGTVFNQLGQPSRIEFSIALRRVDGTRNTLPLGITIPAQ